MLSNHLVVRLAMEIWRTFKLPRPAARAKYYLRVCRTFERTKYAKTFPSFFEGALSERRSRIDQSIDGIAGACLLVVVIASHIYFLTKHLARAFHPRSAFLHLHLHI